MIFVHDAGRLCNNILQYGHLYAWGREHGRPTMSMRFSYKYQYFRICHTRYHHFLCYVLAKYAARWGLITTVRFDRPDEDTGQQERTMLTRRLVMATGWYARWYDLFLKYRQEIAGLFAFDEAIAESARRRMARRQEGTVRLGVHVRRGDYKTWHGGRYCYTDEQYAEMVRHFARLHADARLDIYICGNDPGLDRDYFSQALHPHAVHFPDGNPGEDLCLLSECDYLIGPPSTFTLVASMYHDTPLYWMLSADPEDMTADSFGRFDQLFRQIL